MADAARWMSGLEGLRLGDDEQAYEKGFIADPVNKAKSVVLTDEGLEKAEELFKALFTRQP